MVTFLRAARLVEVEVVTFLLLGLAGLRDEGRVVAGGAGDDAGLGARRARQVPVGEDVGPRHGPEPALQHEVVGWLVGCLTSQQRASVSQGRSGRPSVSIL